MGVEVLGSGRALLGECVDNQTLIDRFGYDLTPEKIKKVTGIEERYIVGSEISLGDIAFTAASRAIQDAGIEDPADSGIDQILVATSTGDRVFPNVASELVGRLGLGSGVSSYDGNSACAGFAKALEVAGNNTNGRSFTRTLVVGADAMSRITNYPDFRTGTLFGDGGGAVLLGYTQDDDKGMLASSSMTFYKPEILKCEVEGEEKSGSGCIEMNGPEVLELILRELPAHIEALLAKAGVQLDEVALHLYHQANGRMIGSLAKRLGVDPSKMPTDGVRTSGNTSSGTLPIVFDIVREQKRITEGDLIVVSGFGSGMDVESSIWRL